MDITPISIIGLLLGALLGVFVTAMRVTDLRDEAPRAFAPARLRALFRPPADRAWRTHLLWAAPRALRLEWIALLALLWLLVIAFWAVAAIRTPYVTDPAWLHDPNWVRGFLVGSLVGFAAAPWIWLHFSRDISAHDQPDEPNAKAARKEALDRYRLHTIILGVMVLFVTFGPQLAQMLRSADKVDVLGVSLSLADHPGGPNQGPVLSPGGNGTSSIGGLTDQTAQARRIGNPGAPPNRRPLPDLDTMGADLADFDYLSVMDRDRAYIAYLLLADRADLAATLAGAEAATSAVRPLARYIDAAGASGAEKDAQFVGGTAPLFACLNYYAATIRDLHLYFIDTSAFLKDLSLEINSDQATAPTKDNLDRLVISATGGRQGANQVEGLQEAIRDVLRRAGLSAGDQDEYGQLACRINLPSPLPAPDLATPYPALLAAYSLAAVESPEAGILYLKNWIVKRTPAPGETPGYARRWHLLRAELALAQIATTTSIQPELPVEPLVAFERKLTDDYADLIHTNAAGGMQKLCERLQTRGIHSGIGRFLAFNYATERSYLFEMETPGLLQSWRDGRQNRSLQNLGEDLRESIELSQAVDGDCFDGVPAFETNRRQWQGQFQLDVAQLSLDRLPTLPDGEQNAERTNISRLLDGARDLLGAAPPDAARTPVERLLSRPSFDTQRQRVIRLRALLNRPIQ